METILIWHCQYEETGRYNGILPFFGKLGGRKDSGDPEIANDSTDDVASVVDVVDKTTEVIFAADDPLVGTESAAVDIVEVDLVEVVVVEVVVVEGSGCSPVEAQTAFFSVVTKVVDVVDVIMIPSAKDTSVVVVEVVEVEVSDVEDAEGGEVDCFCVVDWFAIDDSG